MRVLLVLAPDPELDPEAVEQLPRRLRSEIAELDVDLVRPEAAATPDGAKGGDAVALGPSSWR